MLIDGLNTDDTNIAYLMSCLESNEHISALEFRRTNAHKKTMTAFSMALSCGHAHISELNIIDISLDKASIQALSAGFSHCKLQTLRITNCSMTSQTCQVLFQALEATEQYNTIHHLNMSQNTFGQRGSKVKCTGVISIFASCFFILLDYRISKNKFRENIFVWSEKIDITFW